MIITLMFIGMIIVGAILLKIKESKRRELSYSVRDIIETIGIAFVVIGILCSIFTSAFIMTNVITYDVSYQNVLHEREMLEYRIEHMKENITGNEMLYNDIVEFNNELRETKKWANNPWTNWFNNEDIASLDYIELN